MSRIPVASHDLDVFGIRRPWAELIVRGIKSIEVRLLMCRHWIPFAALFSVLWSQSATAVPRYLVQFQSGKQATGDEILGWQDSSGEPRIGKQKLFFSGDRAQWIEDRTLAPAEPQAGFVEFVTGDRIPGEVIEYRSGREVPFRQLPPHFLVNAGSFCDLPDAGRPTGIPIVARWLKRIVWRKVPGVRSSPGTLIYSDGRRITYRSLRWATHGVRVLLERESRTIPFAEIAEIAFPESNVWNAWLDQWTVVAPTGKEQMIQLETSDGVRLTTSLDRFLIQNRDPKNSAKWYHGFQPAWSLQPLWFSHRAIRMRRYFEAQSPPATLFDPTEAIQKSTFGGAFSWRKDTNVQQLPLRCGPQSFGWGLGVQAYSALKYDLPPFVVAFSSQFGLDLTAGNGGCVQCAVYGGPPEGKPLFQSKVLVGSTRAAETGRIAIPESRDGKRQLSLVVDPRIDDYPQGADPYEIRDLFDWLQPTFEFDLPAFQRELSARVSAEVPAWQGWNFTGPDGGSAELTTRLDASDPKAPCFETAIAPRSKSFALSRTLDVLRDQRILLLSASRLPNDPASRLEVKIAGKSVAKFDVPPSVGATGVEPLLVPIEPGEERSVTIEIVQSASAAGAGVAWRAMALIPADPRLRAVFDTDNAESFLSRLTVGTGTARLQTDPKSSPRKILQVSSGTLQTSGLPQGPVRVRETPELGEYRYLRFTWKGTGKGPIALHFARDEEWGAVEGTDPQSGLRYRAGGDADSPIGPSHVVTEQVPSEPATVTRDLFADFGNCDLTEMRFSAPTGSTIVLEEIVLARRREDLDRRGNAGPP